MMARATTTGVVMLALLSATVVLAGDDLASRRTFSSGYRFVEMTGEELFVNVCQGCHMPDAMGATGAGMYPSLAGNMNLESSGYPIFVIINGRHGMPAFGDMMTDGQIAAVVNYVRTNFGNRFQDAVTAQDVQDARR